VARTSAAGTEPLESLRGRHLDELWQARQRWDYPARAVSATNSGLTAGGRAGQQIRT
jgi:hypothetical protein